MDRIVSICLAISLLVSCSLAKLQCQPYVPHGQKGNQGVISFTGYGNLSLVPSFNATTGNPVKISDPSLAGTKFHFQQCTGATVGSSECLLYCGDETCLRNFGKTIRVINPATGHCLSRRNVTNTTKIELYFGKCSLSETHNHGLWTTLQSTFYKVAYDSNGDNPHPSNKFVYADNATFYPYGAQTACNYDEYCKSRPWLLKNDSATIIAGQQLNQNCLDAVVLTTNWTVVDQYDQCFNGQRRRRDIQRI